tara:strand:+ start:1406 stop:1657 length:252 start_codon:yes stop_codon:yes gene_type:complete
MEKKVLTEDEVLNLKGLREKYQSLTETLGVVEMQNLNIKIKKEQLKLSLQGLQKEEIELAKVLEEKYGNGEISLETGEFLPSK